MRTLGNEVIMARITFKQVQVEQGMYNTYRNEDEPYIGLRRNNGCIFIDFYKQYDATGGYRIIHSDSYGHTTREAWAILHAMNEHRAAMELMK